MSIIGDLLNPGARQAGEAASTAAGMQKAVYDKLIGLQDKLLGFVQTADQQGLFDPERAAQRFNADWQRQHGQDLQTYSAALGGLGYRPGDSEVDYRLSREKSMLDTQRAQGMDQARMEAFNRKLGAYSMTAAPLSGASSAGAMSGQFGMQGAQANQLAQQTTFQNLANLYRGVSPFLKGGGGGGTWDPWASGGPVL